MKRVLIVDDEQGIRDTLSDILSDEGYRVFTAADGIDATEMLKREVLDCVLLDVWLPGKGGMEILEEVRQEYPRLPVVVISGHGTINLAVKAVKAGAFDFLEKPLSLDRVLTLVRNAIEMEELRRENESLRGRVRRPDRLVGRSPGITHVRNVIEQSAESDATVLITGENGTGKELVAREIHNRSSRRDGPFVAVNCAAIPDTLIESELFGHEKGAFTNASARRIGKFEAAHDGTLFLDEVADMSLSAQAKVLRVVQEMRFERIGGEASIEVSVRLIAATNRDLSEAISQGKFREDLYFRLNVIPIHMPPIRDRIEDLPLLLEELAKEFGGEEGRTVRFSEDAMQELSRYEWPGNVRELKNFVERVSIMHEPETIAAADVSRFLGVGTRASTERIDAFEASTLGDAKDQFERRFIELKLRENDFNISRTAEALGIYPSNLHAKLKKFRIRVER